MTAAGVRRKAGICLGKFLTASSPIVRWPVPPQANTGGEDRTSSNDASKYAFHPDPFSGDVQLKLQQTSLENSSQHRVLKTVHPG